MEYHRFLHSYILTLLHYYITQTSEQFLKLAINRNFYKTFIKKYSILYLFCKFFYFPTFIILWFRRRIYLSLLLLPFGQRFLTPFRNDRERNSEQPPIVILNVVKDLSEALAEELLLHCYCPSGKDSSLCFGMTERGGCPLAKIPHCAMTFLLSS